MPYPAQSITPGNTVESVIEMLSSQGFDGMAQAMEVLLNEAMKIERSLHLKAQPYERKQDRSGYANGFKPKTVLTRLGSLDLHVPQVRECDFYPSVLERGLRSERALRLAVAEMYVQGVSTRKVKEITQALCGENISSSQVSRLSKLMDEELDKWRCRPLGAFQYLILDALYEKVRQDGCVLDSAVLVAYGITSCGKREILGLSVSLSEAEIHWRSFLESLVSRGLHGLKSVTSDAHSGLKAALKAVFPSLLWQRCQFHLQQNASAYVPKREMKAEVARDIRSIFNAPSRPEADRLLNLTAEKYKTSASRLSAWMLDNIPEGLSVMALPEKHQRRLRTSNLAERMNKEIRRRTKVVSIFPNPESCLRLISSVLIEFNEDWAVGKSYLGEQD